MKKILLGILSLVLISCTAPQGFIARPAGWTAIQMRENIARNKAWSTLVSVISDNYEIETLDKESGYLRTTWLFETKNGVQSATRITAKIEDNNSTRIKVDSKYFNALEGKWIEGHNTILTQQIKDDLSGRLR
ncbi:MAG: hypothetical protein IJG31_02655 [Fusobacterium sp.]|nr:hypothetical protein [Fusobacterium sp.]